LTDDRLTDNRLVVLRRFAELLDGRRLPIGLDPLLGLIPGVGDVVGAVLAGWVFGEAVRRGASRATLTRIAANIALDAAAGSIPLLGDVFDFVWRANLRNVTLLERHAASPAGAAHADRTFVILIGAALVALVAGLLLLGVGLTVWILRALGIT
jgi:hypothetical protein